MALYLFRNSLRYAGTHIYVYSPWTRKDIGDLSPLLKPGQWPPVPLHWNWNSKLWKRLPPPTGSSPLPIFSASRLWKEISYLSHRNANSFCVPFWVYSVSPEATPPTKSLIQEAEATAGFLRKGPRSLFSKSDLSGEHRWELWDVKSKSWGH